MIIYSLKKMDIVLFNIYDLRIRDHEPLFTANKTENNLIHLFIWDCKWDDKTSNDIQIMGKYKKLFLKECLLNLYKNLNKLNIHLNIYYGDPESILDNLIKKYNIRNIYTYKHFNSYSNNKINYFNSNTMYHLDDLPFEINEIPESFSEFKKQIKFGVRNEFFTKSNNKSIKLGNSININDIDIPDAELSINGGEDIAWDTIKSFFNTNLIQDYKKLRNNLLNKYNFSPWIDFGCISPKSIFFQLKMYEKRKGKSESTYLFWSDLLLNDYYKFISIKLNNKLFEKNGISERNFNYSTNKVSFDKWINGQTGIPIIDSLMIQIKNTGIISNKGRYIVSSFLINDLNLDWLLGAEYFNKILLNSDISFNYGIWQYIAGVNRKNDNSKYFNPIKQCNLYDKNCKFIKYMIPKLCHISNDTLIDPKDGIENYHNLLVKINYITK